MKRTPQIPPLVIMLISGELERLHMALMTATAAGANGRQVIIFAAKSAISRLRDNGWSEAGGTAYDEQLISKGIADYALLVDALGSLNAQFYICSACLRENNVRLSEIDFRLKAEEMDLTDLFNQYTGADFISF